MTLSQSLAPQPAAMTSTSRAASSLVHFFIIFSSKFYLSRQSRNILSNDPEPILSVTTQGFGVANYYRVNGDGRPQRKGCWDIGALRVSLFRQIIIPQNQIAQSQVVPYIPFLRRRSDLVAPQHLVRESIWSLSKAILFDPLSGVNFSMRGSSENGTSALGMT